MFRGSLEENPGSYDLPDSVIGFLRGDLGEPPGGWPEPLRSRVLDGRDDPQKDGQISEEERDQLAGSGRRPVLNRLLLPGPTEEHGTFQERYGDASIVPTRTFLYGLEPGEELAVDLEPGVRLYIRLEAMTEADEHGIRTLMVTVNGQPRPIDAQDRSLKSEVPAREKAKPGNDRHVAAPMSGGVTISAGEGDEVAAGQQIGTIEAMKMESVISAPKNGAVERIVVPSGTNVEPGDLLAMLKPIYSVRHKAK